MNEIYFCHPGKENEIKPKILSDIANARSRVLCAMAFFSDNDIADAILKQDIPDKRVILNNADFHREGNQTAKKIFYELDCMRLGTYYNMKNPSHMHNKILVCDDCVWIGSYNFTSFASSMNWENMLRIDQKDIVDKVVSEFEMMWLYSRIIKNKLEGAKCVECGKIVNDAIKHYAVFINTSRIDNGYFSEDAITTFCIEENDKEERLERCVQCGKMVPWYQIHIFDDTSSCVGVCLECTEEGVKLLSECDKEMYR